VTSRGGRNQTRLKTGEGSEAEVSVRDS
jgi:hypothetical protein